MKSWMDRQMEGRKDGQTSRWTEPTKTIYPFGILCMPGVGGGITIHMSKFRDGRVSFRNSGVKGLNKSVCVSIYQAVI